MRRRLAVGIICTLALSGVAGCTGTAVQPQPATIVCYAEYPQAIELLGPDAVAFYDRVCDGEAIVSLQYGRLHMSGDWFETRDPELVRAVWEALTRFAPGDPVHAVATDYDDILTFKLADGSKLSVCFNAENLELAEFDLVEVSFEELGPLLRLVAKEGASL